MHPPTLARRLFRRAALALSLATLCAGTPPPPPASVTVAGTFQSEQGCPGDWDAACAKTHLTRNPVDGVFRDYFTMPEGHQEFKVTLNDSWDENYGANATRDGANLGFDSPAGLVVKFFYDPVTHWATSSSNSAIPVAAGDFQQALGCTGDWQPECLITWLQDPDGDGIHRFSTTAIPAGPHLVKVAHNENWDENYGANGEPGGANMAFTVPVAGQQVDFSYLASTHQLAITVAAPTLTTLTTSTNRVAVGDTAVLTAKVVFAQGEGTPSGVVNFDFDNGKTVHSVILGTNGEAILLAQAATVGTHTVVARYSGTYQASDSEQQTLVVYQPGAAATATLELAPASAVSGQPVTLTAKVAAVDASAGTPSGSVTFLEGTTELGTAQLGANGQATLAHAFSAGTHALKATYSGDNTFAAVTSAGQSLTVDAAATRTTLTTSKSSIVYSEPLTLRAVVEPVAPGAGMPQGRVTFLLDGSTSLGGGLVGADGSITFTPAGTFDVGTHTLTAKFVSDAPWLFAHSDSAPYTQQVARASTTVTLQMTPREPTLGQVVDFVAQVSAVAPAAGTPSGVVWFKDGATTVGGAQVQSFNGKNTGTFTLRGLAPGPHAFSAEFEGSTSFAGSTSSTLDAPVSKLSSTVFLESPPSPAVSGEGYFLTAQVRFTGGSVQAITGSLTLRDGATELGTEEVSADGRATFGLALGAGTHSLTASYSGDANIYPSTSPEVRATVNRGATTTVLTSSLNPSSSGQAVTLTARVAVTAPAQGKPSGEVLFKADGAALGTGTLDANNQATLHTTALAAGTHALTAEYTGDTQFEASAAQPLAQTVSEQETPDAGTSVDAGTQPDTDAGSQPGTDAGTQPGTDAGTSTDAGIGPTNTPPPTETAGGCGCTAGDGSASGFLLMLGAWVSLSVLRRRASRLN